jgi:CRISPR system Cascade subunit CasC
MGIQKAQTVASGNKTLIEIHVLQNYAPSNLNRDDTGSVKDCVFGGYPRARISSQAIKRSIRKSEFFKDELDDFIGERTKFLPEEIKEVLISKGMTLHEAITWAEKFTSIGKSDKKDKKGDGEKKEKKNNQKEEALSSTAQLMFYGKQELHKIVDWVVSHKSGIPEQLDPKDIHKALKDLKAKPVDIALFGRMTTLEAFEDVTAACQVAHALSANQFSTEFDYFTAVDDLGEKYRDDPGSAHIGETEFTSSCFYKYFALDYDAFLASIGNDKDLAKTALKAFIKAITLANPTGKQNSFAAHNTPHVIGIEIKSKKIPVNLANAFLKPITPGGGKSLAQNAAEALAQFAIRNRNAFALPLKDAAVFLLEGKEAAGGEFASVEKIRFDRLDELIAWIEKFLG